MLAYDVERHMREAWRQLLLADEDRDAKAKRNPVAPAKRSAAALRKACTHRLQDGTSLPHPDRGTCQRGAQYLPCARR
jgi:hypothetical protein